MFNAECFALPFATLRKVLQTRAVSETYYQRYISFEVFDRGSQEGALRAMALAAGYSPGIFEKRTCELAATAGAITVGDITNHYLRRIKPSSSQVGNS